MIDNHDTDNKRVKFQQQTQRYHSLRLMKDIYRAEADVPTIPNRFSVFEIKLAVHRKYSHELGVWK
jgi:hypothetical protein